MRGAGRVAFAGILLIIIGVINVIYGIGALDDANYFVNDTRFVLDNLNTLGWVLIIVGIIQLTGGFSLLNGSTYGRVIGVIAGSLGALSALFSIGGANPWWSLCVFALCVFVVYGIVVYGEDEQSPRTGGPIAKRESPAAEPGSHARRACVSSQSGDAWPVRRA